MTPTAGSSAGGSAGIVKPAAIRRTWEPGQSSVFDSSGSDNSDGDGKPRGLRGVQVLDPETPGTDAVSSTGSATIRVGGVSASSSGVWGGRAQDSSVVVDDASRVLGGGVSRSSLRSFPGQEATGGSAVVSGSAARATAVGEPHLEMRRGVHDRGQGVGDGGVYEFSFPQTRD